MDYSLEIYAPGAEHPVASVESSSPFGAISVGDQIHRVPQWDTDARPGDTWVVRSIEHIIFNPQAGRESRHRIMVFMGESS